VVVFRNGTQQTYTTQYTVNLGTRMVTFVTPPANGDYIGVVYEFVP
jgi:hypothetical protein